VESTCPCHRKWTSAVPFYDHLVFAHGVDAAAAFVLAQLAVQGCPIEYVVDTGGEVVLVGAQLPLRGVTAAP